MDKIKYDFKNPELFELAMTQSGANAAHNNERLEFIGDRVLGLTVAEMLYEMYPDETEGDLARRHAVLVSTETLATVANAIGLEAHLHHGHLTAGRTHHILADAMEALFGAIFIDGGFTPARDVIRELWRELAARDATPPKDNKTALQEFVQKHTPGQLPAYDYDAPDGASHRPIFTATVTAMGHTARGNGSSKKEASTNAAGELLKILAKQEPAD